MRWSRGRDRIAGGLSLRDLAAFVREGHVALDGGNRARQCEAPDLLSQGNLSRIVRMAQIVPTAHRSGSASAIPPTAARVEISIHVEHLHAASDVPDHDRVPRVGRGLGEDDRGGSLCRAHLELPGLARRGVPHLNVVLKVVALWVQSDGYQRSTSGRLDDGARESVEHGHAAGGHRLSERSAVLHVPHSQSAPGPAPEGHPGRHWRRWRARSS